MSILAQESPEVKQECVVEHCHEPRFGDSDLCIDHVIEEGTAKWADEDAECQAQLEGVGYIFGDPVDLAWYGYSLEEVMS